MLIRSSLNAIAFPFESVFVLLRDRYSCSASPDRSQRGHLSHSGSVGRDGNTSDSACIASTHTVAAADKAVAAQYSVSIPAAAD